MSQSHGNIIHIYPGVSELDWAQYDTPLFRLGCSVPLSSCPCSPLVLRVQVPPDCRSGAMMPVYLPSSPSSIKGLDGCNVINVRIPDTATVGSILEVQFALDMTREVRRLRQKFFSAFYVHAKFLQAATQNSRNGSGNAERI